MTAEAKRSRLRLMMLFLVCVGTIRICLEIATTAKVGMTTTMGNEDKFILPPNQQQRQRRTVLQQQQEQQIQTARRNYPLQAQMGTEQIDSIMKVLPLGGNLLVWGLGNDSPYWHNATAGKVMFLEDDFPFKKDGILWYDHIMEKYPFLQAFQVHYSTQNDEKNFKKYMENPWTVELEIANFPRAVQDTTWDVIIVDAPLGCCDMGPARFQALYMSMILARNQIKSHQSQQVHIFVDDYERKIERQFSQQVFGKAPGKVMTRKAGVSNANQQAHFVLDDTDCVVQHSQPGCPSKNQIATIQTARKNYPLQAQMGTEQIDSIMKVLPLGGNLLVWGLGNDSPYWHNATAGKVMFLEDDFPFKKDGILWYDHITEKYPFLQAYQVHYSTQNNKENHEKYMANPWTKELEIANFPQAVQDTTWDVIIVDAPLGCCDMGPARFQALYMSMILARNQIMSHHSQQVHIFVDDYERKIERQFSQRVFGKVPSKVTTRKAGVSNANQQAHFVLDDSDCVVQHSQPDCKNQISTTPNIRTKIISTQIAATNTTSITWTVVLTVNDGFYDFFLNWLAHFKQLNLNHLTVVVVAEDDVVLHKLKNDPRIPASFQFERSRLQLVKTASKTQQQHDETGALDYESPNYMKMVSTRADLLLQKFQVGYNVIYSDVDTVWRKNPLPYIDKEFVNMQHLDMVGQTDDEPGSVKYPYYCTGFMAIRATQNSIQLMKDWQHALAKPQLNQPVFNELVKNAASNVQLKHAPLPYVEFPHGGSYFGLLSTKKREKAVVVHNNYIIGHDVKLGRFQRFGLWLLKDDMEIAPSRSTVTLMTTLHLAKPGTQKFYIQSNTLRALSLLGPEIDIVVFTNNNDDDAIHELCRSLGIRTIPDLETNPHGTPYFKSMFQRLEMDFSIQSNFIGYVNADIMFDSGLLTTLKAIRQARDEHDDEDQKALRRRLLIVGRRTNVQMATNLRWNHSNLLPNKANGVDLDRYIRRLQQWGKLYKENAQDFFIITPGTFDWNDIPDFVIGRPGYDNWLVDYAHHHRATHSLIDVTETVTAIHQTGTDGDLAGFTKRADTKWNLDLGNNRYDHGLTVNANWVTTWDASEKNVVLLRK